MMGGFGMGAAWLFWLLIVVGVVLLVVVLVRLLSTRGAGGSGGTPSGRSPARRLLDDRYARGELTSEEYQERVRTIGEEQ